MKNTTEELLLAAQIRVIAGELRKIALDAAKKAADMEHKEFDSPAIAYTDADQRAQEEAEAARQTHLGKMNLFAQDWLRSNPLSCFVKPAMTQLEEIATIMKS